MVCTGANLFPHVCGCRTELLALYFWTFGYHVDNSGQVQKLLKPCPYLKQVHGESKATSVLRRTLKPALCQIRICGCLPRASRSICYLASHRQNLRAQTGSGPQALGDSRADIHCGLDSTLYLGLTMGVFISTLRISHCGTEVVEGLLNQGRAHAAISIVAFHGTGPRWT